MRLGPLGFGGAVIGNLYRALDDETAAAAVGAAWDAGIRYFDTAPFYGLGLSERRLGAALRQHPRDAFVVSSKVGRLLVPHDRPADHATELFDVPGDLRWEPDYSRDGVLRSLDATLERTGLDRLDMVFVHDPDDHWRQAADEAMPALAELRDQGVIGAVGAGMNESRMLTRFLTDTAADVVMLAGRWTLLDQRGLADVLPAAERLGKSVIAAGVFNSGLTATDRPRADATYDYAPAGADLIGRANAMADVCAEFGTSLPAAAIAFPLTHSAVVSMALGMRTAAEVRLNTALFDGGVPEGLWAALRERRLLDPPA